MKILIFLSMALGWAFQGFGQLDRAVAGSAIIAGQRCLNQEKLDSAAFYFQNARQTLRDCATMDCQTDYLQAGARLSYAYARLKTDKSRIEGLYADALNLVSPEDSRLAAYWYGLGTREWMDGAFEAAQTSYERAWRLQPADTEDQARICIGLAQTFQRQWRQPEAFAWFQRTLSLQRPQGEAPDAPTSARLRLGYVHSELAEIYMGIARYDSAQWHLQKAELIYSKLPEYPQHGLRLYLRYAALYFRLKNFYKALDCLDYARTSPDYATIQPADEAYILNYYGICYAELGQSYRALRYLQAAKRVQESASPTSPIGFNIVLSLGAVSADLEQWEEARKHYEEILGRLKEIPARHPDNGLVHANLGLLAARLNDRQTAVELIQKAIVYQESSFTIKHPQTGFFYNRLAAVYENQKQWTAALRAAHRGAAYYLPSFQDTALQSVPAAFDFTDGNGLLTLLTHKIRLLRLRAEPGDLKAALSTSQYATALAETLRLATMEQSDLLLLAEKSRRLFGEAVLAALAAKRPDLAFEWSQRSKAQVLIQTYAETERLKLAGVTAMELKNCYQMRRQVVGLRDTLENFHDVHLATAQRPSAVQESSQHRALAGLFGIQKNFAGRLQTASVPPPMFPTLSVAEAKATLKSWPQQSRLVDYLIQDSTLVIFVLSSDTFLAKTVPTGRLAEELRGYNRALRLRDSYRYIETAGQLYQRLLAPISLFLRDCRQLLVSPDDQLAAAPFDAFLIIPNADSLKYWRRAFAPMDMTAFARLPYAGRRWSMLTLSAVSGLKAIPPPSPPSHSQLLAVAPEFQQAVYYFGARLAPLPQTRQELTAISRYFRDTVCLRGALATEARTLAGCLSPAEYVHIATHAFYYPGGNGLSGLLLSPDSAGLEAAALYESEIAGLSYRRYLVTLSACESGLGRVNPGDGILSVARGFLCGGAGNALCTLLPVDDGATCAFMTDFYKNLSLRGGDVYVAYAQTKLTCMNSPSLRSSPFHWAAFKLIKGLASPF